MENEVQPNILPVQPPPQNPIPVQTSPSTNWSKILLFTVLGLVIVTGSVFIGIQIGKTQISNQQPVGIQPTASPNQTAVNPTALSTTDSTTDWKVYTNVKYNFEFKYPSNLTPLNVVDNGLIAVFKDISNTKERLSTLPDISIRGITVNPGEDYKNNLIEDVTFDGSGLHPKSFTEFNSTKIGDNSLSYIQTGLNEGILSINYYLLNKNQIIVFTLISSPVDWTNLNFKVENDPLNQNLHQILSTFKFTK